MTLPLAHVVRLAQVEYAELLEILHGFPWKTGAGVTQASSLHLASTLA